jgi:hypothetical protein
MTPERQFCVLRVAGPKGAGTFFLKAIKKTAWSFTPQSAFAGSVAGQGAPHPANRSRSTENN